MNKKFTTLVTGASSGIGKEIAKKLQGEGYIVYGAARRFENMRDIEALGVIPLAMDITKDEEVVGVVKRITEEQGGVDILINNAGFGMYGAVEDTALDDVRYQFEVNLFGLARLTQLVLPYMREQQAGKIVNISSVGGKVYFPLGAWYHGTKHALEGWSDCLRVEVAPFGIDVIIIEPGIIHTEFGDVMLGPMLERSGNSAYADMAHKMGNIKISGSPSSVIAEVVLKALKAKKPRIRYVAGKYAKIGLAMRKWLGDRMFDRIIARRFR